LAADILYRGFQKGTKFGSLTEGALLYITTQIEQGNEGFNKKFATLFSYTVWRGSRSSSILLNFGPLFGEDLNFGGINRRFQA